MLFWKLNGGLEAITAWFSKKAFKKGHDVTLITTKGSSMLGTKFTSKKIGTGKGILSTLSVIETIEPSWDEKETERINTEKKHYLMYKDILEKEYGKGQGIVWDNTWHCYSYLSAKDFPKMKILHTQHGILETLQAPLQHVKYPRFVGTSRLHARYMSSVLKMPVRYVHNGIPLPKEYSEKKTVNNSSSGQYLLSLNRISPEKGIEDAINFAIETGTHIKAAGDDKFSNVNYVRMIKEKCQNSKGYAKYYGLVDNNTKIQLLKSCKAVIACPKPTWMEAFGLYAVEANAYGKPVLALCNGGLKDIVVNGVNGFLAENIEELKGYVDKIDECTPEACRRRVKEMFTDEIMTNNYLSIFEKVLEDDPNFRW